MKILCTLPNASACIGDVDFEPHPDGGMVSVDNIEDESVIKRFCSIPGYKAIEEKDPAKTHTSVEPNKKTGGSEKKPV